MSHGDIDPSGPTTENCRFCWMCRHVCPVGHVTARETLTPHAWALTIESVRRGQLTWNDETSAVMYACADCGLCQTHCVTGQPLPDAIAAARREIVQSGHAPAAVRQYQRAFDPAVEAGTAFSSRKAERVLFVGAASQADTGEVTAALALLEAAGHAAAPAGAGRPTGLVATSLGLTDLASHAARNLVAAVTASGAAEVLVLGPADKWTFEYVYPKRLGVEWPAGVAVTEVTTTLSRACEEGRLGFIAGHDAAPGYHDPCHGPRTARDAAAPRRLLTAVYGDQPAPELFWRGGRAHPCGAIGGLGLTHPDLARRLTTARLDDAVAAGAATVVTDDPSCLAELRRHAGDRVRVDGLYALLRRQLRS